SPFMLHLNVIPCRLSPSPLPRSRPEPSDLRNLCASRLRVRRQPQGVARMSLSQWTRFAAGGLLAFGLGWFAVHSLAGRQPRRAGAGDQGAPRPAARRPWDSARDLPPPIASDKEVKYDYPIVYVRVPRPYPKTYSGINHLNQAGLHQTNAPGAELRLLHPDGRDESLVPVGPHESITDPVVSFDARWVYFAKFHHMDTGPTASMTHLQSRKGADIYKVHVASRKVVQLTTQQRTPNTGAVP